MIICANNIRHLLSKIQQQVVDNSVTNNNSHSKSSTESFNENDRTDHLVNVVFSNNIEIINTPTFPRPEFCKTIGIKAIWVFNLILQLK